jgi:hypothetical protein
MRNIRYANSDFGFVVPDRAIILYFSMVSALIYYAFFSRSLVKDLFTTVYRSWQKLHVSFSFIFWGGGGAEKRSLVSHSNVQ